MRNDEEGKGIFGFMAVAFFAVIAGIAIASAQLALRSVPTKPLRPSDPKTSVVCIMGDDSTSTKGYDDRAKAIMHSVPGNYIFTEGDINALIIKHLSPSVSIDGIEVARIMELPNVRFMEGDMVQVSVILSYPSWFDNRRFIYHVQGKVVPGGFKPTMGWIGQCPLPFFNSYFLQGIRRQLEIDKSIKNLDKVRSLASFSRYGKELFVNVVAPAKAK
jgi:hypothetical protein